MADSSREVWLFAAAVVVAVAVLVHALFPRYEWRAIGEQGMTIVVYDRWTGRMQRATYDEKGAIKPMDVYTPF